MTEKFIEKWKEFQSLIHQVSVSFKETLLGFQQMKAEVFQSLIHQVSVSFLPLQTVLKLKAFMFQSLIHQVSVSFRRHGIARK